MVKASIFEVTYEITHDRGRYLHPTERRRDTETVLIDDKAVPTNWTRYGFTQANTDHPDTNRLRTLAETLLEPRGRRILAMTWKGEVMP